MVRPYVLALAALLGGHAKAQEGTGQELDRPMLGSGGQQGPRKSAMLRFGCSQIVIERLDPSVFSSSFCVYLQCRERN